MFAFFKKTCFYNHFTGWFGWWVKVYNNTPNGSPGEMIRIRLPFLTPLIVTFSQKLDLKLKQMDIHHRIRYHFDHIL